MPTVISELSSLPDKHKALVLLGVLMDPDNIKDIISIDERASKSLGSLIDRLLSISEPARKVLILCFLKESLEFLNSIDEE